MTPAPFACPPWMYASTAPYFVSITSSADRPSTSVTTTLREALSIGCGTGPYRRVIVDALGCVVYGADPNLPGLGRAVATRETVNMMSAIADPDDMEAQMAIATWAEMIHTHYHKNGQTA